MARLRISPTFAADGSGPCSVCSETAAGVDRPSSTPAARSVSSRLSRLVPAPARAWRRVREARDGRFLPGLAGAFGLRPLSGVDGARRGFLRLCALAPVGLPALAQASRGPAAGQIWAPQATPYCVGADVQAERVVLQQALANNDLTRFSYRSLEAMTRGFGLPVEYLTDSQRERAVPLSPECAALPFPCAPTLARQGAAGAPVPGGLS